MSGDIRACSEARLSKPDYGKSSIDGKMSAPGRSSQTILAMAVESSLRFGDRGARLRLTFHIAPQYSQTDVDFRKADGSMSHSKVALDRLCHFRYTRSQRMGC